MKPNTLDEVVTPELVRKIERIILRFYYSDEESYSVEFPHATMLIRKQIENAVLDRQKRIITDVDSCGNAILVHDGSGYSQVYIRKSVVLSIIGQPK